MPTDNKANGESQSINAVERTFTIIETLEDLEGARLTELAAELDMPNSTAHTHLRTLINLGYVKRDGDLYFPSLRFLKHGGLARRQYRLHNVGRRQVDEIATETSEVASLGVRDGGHRVLIYKSEGANAVYDNAPVGEYTRMHWSALGKAILSELSEETVTQIIDHHGLPERTENTITNRDELHSKLASIRDRGYSIEDEERRVGVRSVAVPLTDASDGLIGALSISGPRNRFNDEWIEDEAITILQNAANVIELRYLHD
jgi:DNA-binding IclR family transcriptional regulator